MDSTQFTRRDDPAVFRYDYDDVVVMAADLGVSDDAVSVDVVGETAIVVVEADGRPAQHEFQLPDGEAEVFMKNGVLTVEVRA